MDIVPDEKGKLWIATHHGGLDYFDPVTEKFQHYKHDSSNPGSIGMDSLHTVFIENDKYLWVGAEVGLTRLDRNTGKFTTYRHKQDDSSSISSGSVFKLTTDKNGAVWIATISGLEKFDAKTGKFIHYLPGYSVKAIFKSANGDLWAGATQGLFLYDETTGQFKSYKPDNLPSGIEEILSVIGDKENNIWITTSNAVIRLNTETKIAKVYSAEYGILSSSWNWLNNYLSSDGRIFIGGTKGYYMINPSEMIDNTTPPILNFSKIKISNKEIFPDENGILTQPIWDTKQIILSHEQNAFTIDFNAIDFNSNGPIKYLYQLADFEKDWHDISAEHSASYYGVPPGKYTLNVKAINGEGSMVQKSMEIIITPPWWQTWWAYTVYAILFILLGWGIYKYQKNYILSRERKRSQERELAQAKEIEKAYTELKATQAQLIQSEKMASLGELTAGIAHEIQNPLNFVNNFSEVNLELIEELKSQKSKVKSEENDAIEKELLDDIAQNLEKINHHGKRADAIVKGMLLHSRSSTGQKEPTDINSLSDEYLRLAYHGLRAKDKSFNATMKTDYDTSIGKIQVVSQDIGRVILNLITNAFYAINLQQPKGAVARGVVIKEPTVWITTKKSENNIQIIVKDNGPGIPKHVLDKIFQPFFTTKPAGQGTGLGLSLSYDIIKAHGGQLDVETQEGEMTQFIITLPIK
ncbi:MAG: hypothetical protein IPP79_07475 [Chitinophagaceae bacterium]|nr:hypothetical protein [Chitinophagaceae bacterium]